MLLTSAELVAMYQDTGGVEAVYAPTVGDPVTTWGRLSVAADDEFDGPGAVGGATHKLRIATGTLPGLAMRKEVRVGGTQYKVHRIAPRGDGSLTDVYLGKV